MRRLVQSHHAALRRSAPTCGSPPTLLAAARSRGRLPDRTEGSVSALEVGKEQRRYIIGDVLSVITNPAQTVKNLTDTKRMLEEARQEIKDNQERSQIPRTHTFSPLPGFFPRPRELQALERALSGIPSFTVLFGASSVGKTALMRQVLSHPNFHVIHFDLRLAGFSSLTSLYFSLCNQMEAFFYGLATSKDMPGYEGFEKESWAFKHDRVDVQRRTGLLPMPGQNGPPPAPLPEPLSQISTSDIARLLELFQSALLKYWEFVPEKPGKKKEGESEEGGLDKESEDAMQGSTVKPNSEANVVPEPAPRVVKRNQEDSPPQPPNSDVAPPNSDPEMNRVIPPRGDDGGGGDVEGKGKGMEGEQEWPPKKKVPVFLLDEAHKLPALIQTEDAMKCILDAFLVLTKQDRLCHCLHATSDSFYMHWLRQMNIMQHCKLISVGDCSKAEAKEFYETQLLVDVPEERRAGLDFEALYAVFGGKLAHWSDYVSDYVNSDGRLIVHKSTHYLQAHALLNLHLISPTGSFRIYTPLRAGAPNQQSSTPEQLAAEADAERDFSAEQLLSIMRRLGPGGDSMGLSYFALCREMGARAIDGMVRGRILELRWTDTITPEWEEGATVASGEGKKERAQATDGRRLKAQGEERQRSREVDLPMIVPTTPVIRYAMGEVVKEWEGWTKNSQKRA